MKGFLLAVFAVFALVGCSADYSEDNFSTFQRMADRNPATAIDELRVFIYHNPQHAESMILLGELLVADQTLSERDMYLAQFYLKRALDAAESEAVSAQAEELILQAQLRRGMAPGDPEALINLADYAKANGRYKRAAELYIDASYEYLYTEELTQARDQAQEALAVTEENLVNRDTEVNTWPREYEEALVLLGTIKMARGRFGDAKEYLESLGDISEDLDFNFNQLPETRLISVMANSLDSVASRGFFSWGSSGNVDEEALLLQLMDAEERNQDEINELRTLMSYQIWTQYQSALDESEYPAIAEFVRDTIQFYENRL